MTERDLLLDIAATARRLFPETWEDPEFFGRWARVDATVYLALGTKLKRLEDLRAMVRVVEGL